MTIQSGTSESNQEDTQKDVQEDAKEDAKEDAQDPELQAFIDGVEASLDDTSEVNDETHIVWDTL